MTTREQVWFASETELGGEDTETEKPDDNQQPATPWSELAAWRRQRSIGSGAPTPTPSVPGSSTAAPNLSSAPPTTNPPGAPGAPVQEPIPSATEPSTPLAEQPDQRASDSPGVAPPANTTPALPASPFPTPDPESVARLAPAALTAALSTVPVILSALAGLFGSGGGDSPTNTDGTAVGSATGFGLSPEATRALKVLKTLAAVYGEEETSDPELLALRKQYGDAGDGETAAAIEARQRWQRHAATAFNNLDNQLVAYVSKLAGANQVDRNAVLRLIREVDVALAELGPEAYTPAGQQKVRQILTVALQKANAIVTGSQATAVDTAVAINQLTNQYLYSLSGQQAAAGGAGATTAGTKAAEVAQAQIGKKYEWGAEGPNTFDCSGLMQYAAAAAGVRIPRVAADQYKQLRKVDRSEIQPGDLIFPSAQFNNGNPDHVIMYIGGGQCIEAPQPGATVHKIPLPHEYHATRWT